jgi:hypothetical protein
MILLEMLSKSPGGLRYIEMKGAEKLKRFDNFASSLKDIRRISVAITLLTSDLSRMQ